MIEVEKLTRRKFDELYEKYLEICGVINEIDRYIHSEKIADDKFILSLNEARNAAWKLLTFGIRQSVETTSLTKFKLACNHAMRASKS